MKKLTAEHAMKRLNHQGHWAAERNGKIRIVEFHQGTDGESHSKTFWFDTWTEALEHYGLATHYADHCTQCGRHDHHDEPLKTMTNQLGQWVCMTCFNNMSETLQDLFIYSQGRWRL